MSATLPYRIAVLCYLFDEDGRLLLLHRDREPNKGLYSPIGGKLDMAAGESPTDCALREIREEVELDLGYGEVRLAGLVSETAYDGKHHWLMFLYEVTHPVRITRMQFEEGTLAWHPLESVTDLPIPATDREVIYPLFRQYHREFFHVHIDCRDGKLDWRLEHPAD